ncbi:polysaccharide deacetylase family protein [Streptomyces sp. NPDC088733]|uniref:polysaccharide deacetylase family protein n=1 Tax=Streptomyces sp. NPDC088733 TaxID=3365880 RepID=UPI0038226E25
MALTTRANRTLGVLAVTIAGASVMACGTQHMSQTAAAAPAKAAPTATATPSPATPSAPSAPSVPHSPAAKAPAPTAGTPRTAAPAKPTHHRATAPAHRAHPSHPHTAPAPARPATPPAAHRTTAGTPAHAPGAGRVDQSIQHGAEGGGKSVALTFDDGPDPTWTPKVLQVLAAHHAKATFCEIGPNAAAHPDLVKRISAAGHRLCDHSVHHDEAQSGKSAAYNRHEILDAQQEISRAAGHGDRVWYYRAPGGDFSPAIRAIAAGHGLRPLGWTVDSEDWRRPGVDSILKNVNSELKPGGIILMHDGGGDRSQTVQALETLLDRLDAAGYTYTFPGR